MSAGSRGWIHWGGFLRHFSASKPLISIQAAVNLFLMGELEKGLFVGYRGIRTRLSPGHSRVVLRGRGAMPRKVYLFCSVHGKARRTQFSLLMI